MAKTSKAIPTDPIRKAVVYARVSSKEQEKEGFSIPAQLKLLKDYAAAQGLAVTKEYVDVETAKQTGRTDPPPLKWSDLRYVFDIQEDCNGKEAIQA